VNEGNRESSHTATKGGKKRWKTRSKAGSERRAVAVDGAMNHQKIEGGGRKKRQEREKD